MISILKNILIKGVLGLENIQFEKFK
jgi:hypothetical protein